MQVIEVNVTTGERKERDFTPEEVNDIQAAVPKPDRKTEIQARLQEIDAGSVRALRAAIVATAKGAAIGAGDRNKLESLETEAAALRAELSTM